MPETTNEKIPEEIDSHPAWGRLEEQRKWYSSESSRNKRYSHRIKITQIILASAIPLIALLEVSWGSLATALAGSTIAVLEAIQQLNQYSQLWIEYRSVAERLKRDKNLFLAEAGPYRGVDVTSRLILLAERVEDHVATEHERWISGARQLFIKSSEVTQPDAGAERTDTQAISSHAS